MSGTDENALADRLGTAERARLSSLRLTDGVATAVFSAEGLDPAARGALEAAVQAALGAAPGVSEVRVGLVADKPKRQIIAVGSGKGGVGKSTVAANLAVALARSGKRVGMVDADIYGPSQPRLLGVEGTRPVAHGGKLIPVATGWGVPLLSMGQLVEPGKAIAWRGPMVSGALGQLLDAAWESAEILVVDLPPGTGDVQLTMIQKHRPAGALIVSTPQDLALIDAARAVNLFEQAGVPVIGVVENMAGYVCPHCGEVSDPFGSGGAEHMAAHGGHDFLARIPLTMALRAASDAGEPVAATDGPEGRAFAALASRVSAWLEAQ